MYPDVKFIAIERFDEFRVLLQRVSPKLDPPQREPFQSWFWFDEKFVPETRKSFWKNS